MNNPMHKVVITGLGVISPIGIGTETFWQALLAGKCGAGEISSFDSSAFKVHRAYEVTGYQFDARAWPGASPHLGRASQFALTATRMAMADAGLECNAPDSSRMGISLGTTGGEIQILEGICEHLAAGAGHREIPAACFPYFPANHIIAEVAARFGCHGPHYLFPNACAAGNYAIGYAFDLIRLGRADIMICGGVEPFSPMALTGFSRLNAVAPDLCRPFDRNRKGLMLGEGAGILILESLPGALHRNAPIYAEVAGYGISCDSYHVTSPHPTGRGKVQAMQKALAHAGLPPGDIAYINAHGTGTRLNDKVETLAIRTLFGPHADQLKVSSIKGHIGHTMGAASAIEAVACTLTVSRNQVPPTIHLETGDPDCDLNYVPKTAITAQIDVAMNNAFAFGGNNTSLVLKKYTPIEDPSPPKKRKT